MINNIIVKFQLQTQFFVGIRSPFVLRIIVGESSIVQLNMTTMPKRFFFTSFFLSQSQFLIVIVSLSLNSFSQRKGISFYSTFLLLNISFLGHLCIRTAVKGSRLVFNISKLRLVHHNRGWRMSTSSADQLPPPGQCGGPPHHRHPHHHRASLQLWQHK